MIYTKYITADEFKEYTGIDLTYEMEDTSNDSDKVNAFINRQTILLRDFIDATFNRKIDNEYPVFTDYQKEHYKLALLEQMLYVFKNGDRSIDSGYDPEQGFVADKNKLESIIISPNTRKQLVLCGIWNRNLGSKMNFQWIIGKQ